MRAFVRSLGTHESDLPILPSQSDGVIVDVPGFGVMLVLADPPADHPNANTAILTRGPGTERYLDVVRVNGRIEVELLHKADSLCVVIDPSEVAARDESTSTPSDGSAS